MAEERAQRRLAAILAADVVGYSRLMERDEAGTFERLRAHRKELFEPEIAKRQGRIFKLMGDGLLAEFASIVDAVECAASLQRAMAERNAGLAGVEHRQRARRSKRTAAFHVRWIWSIWWRLIAGLARPARR
jgi:class 3 adenylate cyclase